LASGVGIALRYGSPSSLLVGCWPENAPALQRALETGKIHEVPEFKTISDGTAGGIEPESITLPLCSQVIGRRTTVTEGLVKSAMWAIAEHDHWMVEGAAGVALAGLASMRRNVGEDCRRCFVWAQP